jgi:hypothetical protein
MSATAVYVQRKKRPGCSALMSALFARPLSTSSDMTFPVPVESVIPHGP